MDEQHTPIIEALVRLPASLPAVVDAVRCERQLRPLLMRMLQHAADAARRRAVSIGSIDRIGLVILSHPFVHQWSEADLQPYQATAAQLAAAIDSRRQYLLHIDLDTTAYKHQPLAQEEALYRIVQEALNNIVKHAQARRIEITLRAVGGLTSLTVRDDGRGFALEPAEVADGLRSRTAGGLGLRIMRECAEALRGRIDMISAPGKGTIVDVRLPQEDERP